jgi:hypothetical protein
MMKKGKMSSIRYKANRRKSIKDSSTKKQYKKYLEIKEKEILLEEEKNRKPKIKRNGILI